MLTAEESVELLKLRQVSGLNQKGQDRLRALERKNLPETTGLERFLIGTGRGMMDIYQGAKQKGLQFGEAVGLADPGSAQAYTDQVNQELQLYNRLAQAHPWQTGAGRFAGGVAAAPIPGLGASLPMRLATGGAMGAGIGATEFTPSMEAGDVGRQALFGGAGAVGGEAVGAGLGRLFQGRPARPPLPHAEAIGAAGGREAGVFSQAPALPPPPMQAAGFTPEYGIPLTSGQVSGSIPAQQFEQRVLRGNVLGDPAQRQLDEFLGGQQAAINEAYDEATGRVTGRGAEVLEGEPRGAPLEAAERLRARAGTLMDDVDEAYRLARQARAYLTPEDTRGMFNTMRASLSREALYAPDLYPQTHAFLQRMDEYIPLDVPGRRVTGVEVEGLNTLRRLLGDHIGAAESSDRRTLTRLKGLFDQELLSLADEGRLLGDEDALRELRRGIQLRADYGRLYGPREASRRRSGRKVADPAGRAIEDIIEDTTLTSDDVMNRVFGASLGGNKNTGAILRRVEDAAGRESPEYDLFRLAAMEKIRQETLSAGTDNISVDKFRTKWEKLKARNMDLVDQLFTGAEVEELDTLLGEMGQAQYSRLALNPSQTAFMLENIIRRAAAPAMGAAAGGMAGGMTGAAAGATASFFATQAQQQIRDALGRLFARRIYRPPAGAAGRALGPIGREAGLTVEEEMYND
ncbi:MAG: hypothetical protein PVI97_00710 [Candidatus Thiodiazotropha sp.]|jgi:hypothetical protein